VAQYSSAPEVLGLPAGKPAVVGLFPDAGEATARFVHRPAPPEVTGQGTWSRLELEALPPEPPKAGLGGRSAQQLTEELRLLAALAIEPAGSTPGAAAPAEAAPEGEASRAAREGAEASADPVDRLAAWLLSKRQA
jgi:hypothetical protein